VARGLLAERRIEPLEMLDGVRLGIELLELMLREVADLETLRFEAFAVAHVDRAGQQLDQRRLAGAVRAEQRDAVARHQAQLDARQPYAVAVARRRFVESRKRIRQRFGFAELETDRRRGAHRRDLDHALERLDAALRLARLAGLRFEAVDEALQVRAL